VLETHMFRSPEAIAVENELTVEDRDISSQNHEVKSKRQTYGKEAPLGSVV
jgi:hypothetical protein